jgi:EAL domain-containing protein (putative c-di-GMP-specific phosphodiesterase class I)
MPTPGNPAERVRQDRDRFIGFAFASADLLLEIADNLRIGWAGGACNALLGIEAADAVGRSLPDFLSVADSETLDAAVTRLRPGERRREIEVELHPNQVPARRVVAAIYRELGAGPARYYASFQMRPAAAEGDGTRRRDRATGLIEAVQFAEATGDALRTARASGVPARLTLVQICGEEVLRKQLGADRSAALMAEIGSQLRRRAVTPEGAIVLGDGKFSVTEIDGSAAEAIGDTLARIGENYQLPAEALDVRESSISFAGASLLEDDVESILGHVLEKFRTGGIGAVQGESAESYLKRMTAETLGRVLAMRDLIHEQRLNLHYQPIVSVADRKTHHYEVLLRFADGRSPFEDIVFAEQINTIHEIDLAVANGATARLKKAAADGDTLSLAINMSARSLLNDTFLGMFDKVAGELGAQRNQLIVEITESAKVEDLERAAKAVSWLNRRSHPVCLDDFGAGAASLPYLQQLDVAYVKIDGAYVRRIHERQRERAIVEGVLTTCRQLGVKTVAEMVEQVEQHAVLIELGVGYGQGWLYGRPNPEIPSTGVRTARASAKVSPDRASRLLVRKN